MMRWLGRFTGAAAAVAISLGVLVLVALQISRPTPRRSLRPGVRVPSQYAIQGIDVSHHQGRIDWPRVGEEVDFAFIKATEGRSHVDRRFARNWREARATGLPTGAYHYFSACRTGAEQARHFIATVPREADALPAVLDVEEDTRCNRGRRLNGVQAEVTAWLDAVEAHYGTRPMVYSSVSFRRSHLPTVEAEWWIAAYSRRPRDWVFWQHTDRARVPGIRGPVDRNVFVGKTKDFLLIRGEKVAR